MALVALRNLADKDSSGTNTFIRPRADAGRRPQIGRTLSRAPRAWHRDAEDCTALISVLSPHSPVVSLDDGLHDRQTQAQALRLRGEERLEEVWLNIRGQSRPVVAHCNLDLLAPNLRSDGDVRIRRRRGRIERVDQEIHHDLLKLNGITGDRWYARIEREGDVRKASQHVVLEKACRCSTDFVEVHRLWWQFLSSDQRANPRDDVGGQHIVRDDVAEDLFTELSFVVAQSPRVTRHDPGASFRVHADRGERLTKVVRHRRRELADEGHAPHVRDLTPRLVGAPLLLLGRELSAFASATFREQ